MAIANIAHTIQNREMSPIFSVLSLSSFIWLSFLITIKNQWNVSNARSKVEFPEEKTPHYVPSNCEKK